MADAPKQGWRTYGDPPRCDHCCNGDRCDDRTHIDRRHCPYCLGTGEALWLPGVESGVLMRGEKS